MLLIIDSNLKTYKLSKTRELKKTTLKNFVICKHLSECIRGFNFK